MKRLIHIESLWNHVSIRSFPMVLLFDDAPFFEGGSLIGMSGKKLRVILSGDSAYVMPFFHTRLV